MRRRILQALARRIKRPPHKPSEFVYIVNWLKATVRRWTAPKA